MLITAAKEIMFHGTSSKFLRSILKKGLVVNSKERVYEEEYDNRPGVVYKDLESYSGIYFSVNYGTAYGAGQSASLKFGGNILIIVAQIETQTPSVVIDEDYLDMSHYLTNYVDLRFDMLIDYNNDFKINEYLLNVSWESFKEEISSKYKFFPKDLDKLKSYFEKAMTYYIYFRLLTYSKGNFTYTEKYKIYEPFKEKYDMKEMRSLYREHYDKFLKKANFLANLPEKMKNRESNLKFHSVRLTNPIAYSGKNRILAIVEIEKVKFNHKVIIHKYHSSVETLLAQDEKFNGKPIEVIRNDKSIKADYESDREHAEELNKTGFWGKQGAGCLFLALDTKRILFAHRSELVQEPNTFGTWGGAIDRNESPEIAVKREIKEEAGYKKDIELVPLKTFKHESDFVFYNFLAIVDKEFKPKLDWETQGYKWVEYGNWPKPIHPGAKYLLEHSSKTIKKIIGE